MACPQKINGYTGIANEILEKLSSAKLNGCQYAVILVVLRYTYGFQRKEHELSLSFISSATGFDKRQVQRELKALESKKIIFQKVVNGISRKIGFSKDWESWNLGGAYGKDTYGKNTVGDTVNKPMVPTASPPTKKETPKENPKENIPYSEIIDYLNIKAETRFRSSTKDTREHIHARWEEGARLEDFKIVIDKKVTGWTNTEQAKYLRPMTLFGPRFEGYLNEKTPTIQGKNYNGPLGVVTSSTGLGVRRDDM